MVPPLMRQIWVVSAVFLDIMGLGMTMAYTSCLLPALRADDSTIKLDLDTASWILSSIGMTMTFGIFISSVMLDRLGRRWSHLLLALPNLAGWLCIHLATNATTLFIGRLANGISGGSGFVIGSIAIGEYSSPKYRGLFITLKNMCLIVGSMVVHALSDLFHWRTIALICAAPALSGVLVNYTWPESPSWLVSKNKFEDCERVFYWLRGRSDDAVREFEALVQAQKARTSVNNAAKILPLAERALMFVKKIFQRGFYKPVLIIISSFLSIEAVGRHYFPALAVDIMSDIFEDKSQSFVYIMIIDIMMLISCVLSCFLVKMFKRRVLLFSCGIISIVLLLALSLYLFLVSLGTLPRDSKVLPALLILYFIVSNCGFTTIPYVLFGEIFPLPHRASGSGIGGAITTVLLTIVLKITPLLMASIRVYGTFGLYAGVMMLSLLYLYFALPETKDKTLQEIEDYFNTGRFPNYPENPGDDQMKLLKPLIVKNFKYTINPEMN